MKVLGIETSCDETAVAIVNDSQKILAHLISSKLAEHNFFGGVVPEIAARNHMDCLDLLVAKALNQARHTIRDIDAIAVTAGPGLIGGLIVGVMLAKGIAAAANKPFVAVNHLEAHALTVRLTHDVDFPFLLLLVSGGHCQLLEVLGVGKYNLLGSTLDDAVGEAFDKVAKMLGFGYPGGAIVEEKAKSGNPKAFKLPLPLLHQGDLNFSFSGLKTAVKRIVDAQDLTQLFITDLCASFQAAVGEVLSRKVKDAVFRFAKKFPHADTLVLAGGVAANQYLRERVAGAIEPYGFKLVAPPLDLCTDNGVMVAWAGLERYRLNMVSELTFEPRSRWPLMEL